MTRTKPKKVVKSTFVALTPMTRETRSAAPTGHDAMLVCGGLVGSPTTPKTNALLRTMYAMSDAKASIPSESIAPPPTGRASVSMSSCFADDELLTRLCQPEIAPQAIATNRIGQIGPRIPWGSNKNGPAGIWTLIGVGAFGNVNPRKLAPQNGVMRAPKRIKRMAAYAG